MFAQRREHGDSKMPAEEMERPWRRWDYRVALIYDDRLHLSKGKVLFVRSKYRGLQKTWVLQFKCGRLFDVLCFVQARPAYFATDADL